MKRAILMLAATVAIAFTSCKNDKNASDEMNENKSEMSAEKSGKKSEMKANQKKSDMGKKSAAAKNGKFPKMNFEESSHDFGKIDEGDRVKHTFQFTNTGDAPLKISKARGSCGCTVPKWPKGDIAPGETGDILVIFNSRGRKNKQMKSVRLTTNTKKGTEMLRISADVKPKS